MDDVIYWLVEVANNESMGHPGIAEIILQILESTMMPKVIHDPRVQMELLKIVQTNDPGPALDTINEILEIESRTSELAQMYIWTLQQKHAECIDPPFGPLSSRLWLYQSWDSVPHFNDLLITIE